MPRVCTLCSHPERHRIDAVLAEGATVAAVARTFGVSESAARRHKNDGHGATTGLVVTALSRRLAEVTADGIVGEMLAHYERALTMLDEATGQGKGGEEAGSVWEPKDRVALLKEVRQSIEGMARVGVKLARESRDQDEHEERRVDLNAALDAALARAEQRNRRRRGERDGANGPGTDDDVIDVDVVEVGE